MGWRYSTHCLWSYWDHNLPGLTTYYLSLRFLDFYAYDFTIFQDVVYALAHATAQTGRFTLVERWRNNERYLAPYDNPLKVKNLEL